MKYGNIHMEVSTDFDPIDLGLSAEDVLFTAGSIADGLRNNQTQVLNVGMVTYTVTRVDRTTATAAVHQVSELNFDFAEDSDINEHFNL